MDKRGREVRGLHMGMGRREEPLNIRLLTRRDPHPSFPLLADDRMATRAERDKKKQNDEHALILQNLLAEPGNKFCAECGTKGE